MTGWRIGYAAGPREIIQAMTNHTESVNVEPNSIAQKAAVEALNGPQDFIQAMVQEFDKRRRYLVSELNAIPGISCMSPTGAFYAFPNTSGLYGRSCTKNDILFIRPCTIPPRTSTGCASSRRMHSVTIITSDFPMQRPLMK